MAFNLLYFILAVVTVATAAAGLDPSSTYNHDVLVKATPIAPLPYDGVISYRRTLQSRHLATLVKTMLKDQAVSTYMDTDDGQNGIDHNQLLANIRNTSNLIVILSPNSLDACLGDNNFADPMHQEIKVANDLGIRFVPVFDGYNFPRLDNYSQPIKNMMDFQGVSWTHILAKPSSQKVIQYMETGCKISVTSCRKGRNSCRNRSC